MTKEQHEKRIVNNATRNGWQLEKQETARQINALVELLEMNEFEEEQFAKRIYKAIETRFLEMIKQSKHDYMLISENAKAATK